MTFRTILATLLLLAFAAPLSAVDVDVVIDDFESYATDGALQAAWVSSTASTTSTFRTTDNVVFGPNITGQAAVFDGTIGIGAGSVNQWSTPFAIAPSATQNVELSVDLGHEALTSNKKLSLGLRSSAGANIIELGFWNQFLPGPNGEFFQFAHRAILLPGGDNWQPFGLSPSLDQIFEVANPSFHRFKAIISQTDITFTLDLFADGINNAPSAGPADFDGSGEVDGEDFLIWQRNVGIGTLPSQGDANGDTVVNAADLAIWETDYGMTATPGPGVDAIDVVPAAVTAAGFDDLRFGIPSAAGSSADPFLGVDNVSLRLVDIPPPIGAVPEPTSAALVLSALAGLALAARRR